MIVSFIAMTIGLYVCMCIYIYTYIYIHIHIYIYIPIVIAINDTTIYRYLADSYMVDMYIYIYDIWIYMVIIYSVVSIRSMNWCIYGISFIACIAVSVASDISAPLTGTRLCQDCLTQ